jgi:hypothetical protein
LVAAACLLLLSAACSGADQEPQHEHRTLEAPAADGHLFTLLPSSYTGVRFENRLHDTHDLNVFTYRNYYNGGGVALGDLNGDGLPDLMLTGNQGGNRLYLNEGEFRFRDITDEAGVEKRGLWATGVTFADVNGDGRLDIYVCYAGPVAGARRANELFINQGLNANGVPTFREQAAKYGLDDRGFSTQAAFFDYDRDGDLDMFLVNNSSTAPSILAQQNTRNVRDPLGGETLYRNDGGHFVDVSAKAGIFGSTIGFGLGVVVSDVNDDDWPDLYVSNDFFERDYLYINKHDGTFSERIEQEMPATSYSSMGLDIADLDNDRRPDVYVTDMLPEDDYRLKLMSTFESWGDYRAGLAQGFHHQFQRNTLQRNNGNGTFSEVGQIAGVARTDWSWSALVADYDLDGRQDIYVTNGIARDLTSQDYLAFLGSNETMRAARAGKRVDFAGLIAPMTTTPLPNYAFRNAGDLMFSNAGAAWGLDAPSFSNGAAYGDLDGDGAIDLVVNNINQEAFVYRNNARTQLPKNHYLQVKLEGVGPNPFGVGAKVTLRTKTGLFFKELQPTRGFQSSVDYVLTFGIGNIDTVPSIDVEWPDGRTSTLPHLAANKRLVVRQDEAQTIPPVRTSARPPILTDVTDQIALDFVHHENAFVDFDREPLIPKLLSTEGPFVAVGDMNGDGRDDFFIGGAKEQASGLYEQREDGSFFATNQALLAQDRISEDLGAVFFGRDLYVVTGGSEFSDLAPALEDRLYSGDGRSTYRKTSGRLPPLFGSGSRVVAADFDGDGDVDVFVGGRVVPWRYGIDPPSTLLENDGHGRFTDVTRRLAPELAHVGMVTDAAWTDVDGDGRLDLVVVGEWMPIAIFHNAGGGKLVRLHPRGLERSDGWWNRIVVADVTGDGRPDFVVGNLGLNTRLHVGASPSEPASMLVGDFDHNGFVEQLVSTYSGGVLRPLALRDDLQKALPSLKAQFPTYDAYARATTADVSRPDGAVEKHAYTFATSLVRNNGDGSFTLVPLPRAAQLAPVYGILAADADRDGHLDLLLAGNFDGVKPEIGRMGASYGLFLRGNGRGGFTPVEAEQSGFLVRGEARDIQRLRTRHGDVYIVTRNNDRPLFFSATPARARELPSAHHTGH